MHIRVKQLGKPEKALELSEGSTISTLLSELGLDASGKQFTVSDDNGTAIRNTSYTLTNFATVSITSQNQNG